MDLEDKKRYVIGAIVVVAILTLVTLIYANWQRQQNPQSLLQRDSRPPLKELASVRRLAEEAWRASFQS